jgi:Carboxypeptidase regulatory-like domain/Divergent InlB B-repeat domain
MPRPSHYRPDSKYVVHARVLAIPLFIALLLMCFGTITMAANPRTLQPKTIYPVKRGVSKPLRNMKAPRQPLKVTGEAAVVPIGYPKSKGQQQPQQTVMVEQDSVLQQNIPTATMPATSIDFEGLNNIGGYYPPDTCGDVGPDHYVQITNVYYQVYDKTTGAPMLPAALANNAMWTGFGGVCETTNHGDPIVLYDQFADRWLFSQFSINGPFHQCIAISQTGDPTGAWYLYDYEMSTTIMNDYPKFGVWPDGYYMAINQFDSDNSNGWAGQGVAAFDRDTMLTGGAAPMVYIDMVSNTALGAMLPADADGSTPPPPGTPNYFIQMDDDAWGYPDDQLEIYEFSVDWTPPAKASFTVSAISPLTVASFTTLGQASVPQPDTSQKLDNLGDRLMYRLQYRNFGTHQSMVVNHTVDIGSGVAGIRWYELRDIGSNWVINQQGTYGGDASPQDGEHRWMGSIAMDFQGNMGLGYSVSGNTTYPSIRYVGRLAGDPPGTLSQGEAEIIAGSGSQTGSGARWGDYSMMSVDPVDDCTFWYTTEYYETTSVSGWQTRIASFKFPGCTTIPSGLLQGTVTDSGAAPLEGVTVSADDGDSVLLSTTTAADGSYRFSALPVGTYTVTAEKFIYVTATAPGVAVELNSTTTRDFILADAPLYTLNGTVTDANTGWPLYAEVSYGVGSLWTDPLTGIYSVDLPEGNYTLSTTTESYAPAGATVTLNSNTVQDFVLQPDTTCSAPGYTFSGSICNAPTEGGLVVGTVFDAITSDALNGALVDDGAGHSVSTMATPDDDNLYDGFYSLFLPSSGSVALTVTKGAYVPGAASVFVPDLGTARMDWGLEAAQLSADPNPIEVHIAENSTLSIVLNMVENIGITSADFEFIEVNAPPPLLPNGPFADLVRHVSPKHLDDIDASGARYSYPAPDVPVITAAGDVLQTWGSGLSIPWGVGHQNASLNIWLSSPAAGGGDDLDHEFDQDGTAGSTIDIAGVGGASWMADLTYDWNNGTLWQMAVGGDNCIHELDTASLTVTGNTICPSLAIDQRGLAYNPKSDTFYAGGWNDSTIHEFDRNGTILRSTNVGLAISGLAFNPSTDHLFVMVNGLESAPEIYIVDVPVNSDFVVSGQFAIAGFNDYSGAGLAIGCDGSLWAAQQNSGDVYEVDSGEMSSCDLSIPWLTETPVSGTVAAGSSQEVNLDFDSTGYIPGTEEGYLRTVNSTPYGSFTIPVTMIVEPDQQLSVLKEGSGSGTVTADNGPVNCGATCSGSYPYNTPVLLTATAVSGSTFMGWGGNCSGNDATCAVTMDQVRTVSATFLSDSAVTHDLQVSLDGSGSGGITSSPGGIYCGTAGTTCSTPFDDGIVATLTATAESGSMFMGWSGDCTGNGPCTIDMTQAHNVSATFTNTAAVIYELITSLTGNGAGGITSSPTGIFCGTAGSTCTAPFDDGAGVTLTAAPATGTTFVGWSGDCLGSSPTCDLTMDQTHSASALFTLQSFDLTVNKDGEGDGMVTSNPAGIDCGSDCTEPYNYGSQVVLTALADQQSDLTGWQGSCDEPATVPPSPTCTVGIYQAEGITVSFDPTFPWPMFIPAITGSGTR